MNLHTHTHTLIAKQWISTLNYTQPHTMNKRISIFVASAFEEKKNTKSNQVISKNVFLYKQHTYTHTTKYEYYTEFFRRACSSANRKKGTNIKPGSSFCIILTIPLTTTTTTTTTNWICYVTLPTHQYNKQKKHKSKQWKNKKHSTQINPTFLERLLTRLCFPRNRLPFISVTLARKSLIFLFPIRNCELKKLKLIG